MSLLTRAGSLVLAAALLLAAPWGAWADTDYHCLNLCVEGGKVAGQCLKSCAYGLATPKTESKDAVGANHRVLPTLRAGDRGQIVLKSAPDSPYVKKEDYVCLSACLKGGFQYQACRESCAATMTRSGQTVTPATGLAGRTGAAGAGGAAGR